MKILLIFTFCLIQADTDAVTTVTGYGGRSVEIKCVYESGYERNKKYFCRGKCSILWHKDIPVESGSPAKDTRFTLNDDTTAKVFTVTITDLRPADENTYWCGIERSISDLYTQIQLLVKTNEPAIRTLSQSTHSTLTHTVSPPVHAEITHSTAAKPLHDTTHPSVTPSPQEFPPSAVIISVSVLVVLLLIALLFAVVLQRKMKTKASSPDHSPQCSSNLHVVPCPDYGYEEIKDSKRLPNTVYSTAVLPSTIYSNGSPTFPSDFSQTFYTTVKHPSGSPDQDVYSTAQLPTILSDSSVSAAPPSAVKSGESLTYAAVTFDTRSHDAAPTVIYKNEDIPCDYATVNVTKCS